MVTDMRQLMGYYRFQFLIVQLIDDSSGKRHRISPFIDPAGESIQELSLITLMQGDFHSLAHTKIFHQIVHPLIFLTAQWYGTGCRIDNTGIGKVSDQEPDQYTSSTYGAI